MLLRHIKGHLVIPGGGIEKSEYFTKSTDNPNELYFSGSSTEIRSVIFRELNEELGLSYDIELLVDLPMLN